MGRIANLTEKPLAGAEFVVNAADDTAGFVPADELATAAQGALADTAVQPEDFHAASAKTTPVDADELSLWDSAASWAQKNFTFANLKTWVKSWIVKGDVGLGNVDNTSDTSKPVSTATQTALDGKQAIDADLTAIADLSPSNDDVIQRKAGAWINRTMTQLLADLAAFVGDSGSGGTKGLVPAPAAGDAAAAKYLKADGTWDVPAGGSSTDIPAEIHAATSKATPVDADELALVDSDASWALKKLTWANLKATLLGVFGSNGMQARTSAGVFAARTITGTANQISVANGDGVSGNPTLSLPADVIIPTVITAPNTGLHILDTDASHDVIFKPGSDVTADRTVTIITGDADRTLDLTVSSSTGLVELDTYTVSGSVSIISFTGIDMTGYKSLVMVFENVCTAVSATDDTTTIQYSTDNGSTWKGGASDYVRNVTATSSLGGPGVSGDTSTFKYGNAVYEFLGFGDSTRATTALVMGVARGLSTTSITITAPDVRGTRAAAEAENAIRIIPGGGNFNAGTVTIFGRIA